MIGLSAYVCVYTAYSTTLGYLEYDVITVTKRVVDEEVVFPAVTLCKKKEENKDSDLNFRNVDECTFEGQACNITSDLERFTRDKGTFWCLRFNGYRKIRGSNKRYSFKKTPDIESDGFYLKLNNINNQSCILLVTTKILTKTLLCMSLVKTRIIKFTQAKR